MVCAASDDDRYDDESMDEYMVVPITDEIDLHTFSPRDVKHLLPEYFHACREKGILEVRVIHGKGTGQLRAKVESLLGKSPLVEDFFPAPPERGGWGATVVRLIPDDPE